MLRGNMAQKQKKFKGFGIDRNYTLRLHGFPLVNKYSFEKRNQPISRPNHKEVQNESSETKSQILCILIHTGIGHRAIHMRHGIDSMDTELPR